MSHAYWNDTGTPWTPKPAPGSSHCTSRWPVTLLANPAEECDPCDNCTEECDRCEHGFCSACCGCDGAAEAMFEGDR